MRNSGAEKGAMKNVVARVTGTGSRRRLLITVDLSRSLGTSSTKKSLLIATTGGNKEVPDEPSLRFNLNVIMPLEKS